VTDDSLTRSARQFRDEAIAALVATLRNSKAPASAKTQAATKLLEYAEGRPGQSQPIKVADLDKLAPDERHQLYRALVTYYAADLPDLQSMIKEVVDQAQELLEQSHPKRKPNPFTRGPGAGRQASSIAPPAAREKQPFMRETESPALLHSAAPSAPEDAFLSVSSAVADGADTTKNPPSDTQPPKRGFRGNGLIGDIPIDQDVNKLIRRNGAGNGYDVESDMSRLLSGYNAARWTHRQ
jgi:hypothetical protein